VQVAATSGVSEERGAPATSAKMGKQLKAVHAGVDRVARHPVTMPASGMTVNSVLLLRPPYTAIGDSG